MSDTRTRKLNKETLNKCNTFMCRLYPCFALLSITFLSCVLTEKNHKAFFVPNSFLQNGTQVIRGIKRTLKKEYGTVWIIDKSLNKVYIVTLYKTNVGVCSTTLAKRKRDSPYIIYSGADDEARTRYLHLGKVALYQMSYIRK